MKVAAADIGTNSSHLLIVQGIGDNPLHNSHQHDHQHNQTNPSTQAPKPQIYTTQEDFRSPRQKNISFRILQSYKSRTKLGECLDEAGNITPEGEDRLAQALLDFRILAENHNISEVHVYATSAMREAPNGEAVAKRMQERTGLYPLIISGEQEGRLTYLGILHSLQLGNDNVILDLGGGSLELARGDKTTAHDVLSLPLGSIRMKRRFLATPMTSPEQIAELRVAIKRALRPHIRRFAIEKHTRVALSSGTAETIAKILTKRTSINGANVKLSDLETLIERLRPLSIEERASLPHLDRRADIIVAGLVVLHTVLSELGATTMTISEGALRDGMLIEEFSKHDAYVADIDSRQRSILSLAEHFRADLSHASHVSTLASTLFDQILDRGYPLAYEREEARNLLNAAAILHDIGNIVSTSGHHKHSAYLIRQADFPVYSSPEKELIALIARYHRKSMPKHEHGDYMALEVTQRNLVSQLAAILRVADGLDRSHSGFTRIKELHRSGHRWTLELSEAKDLDINSAEDKADLWHDKFGTLKILCR